MDKLKMTYEVFECEDGEDRLGRIFAFLFDDVKDNDDARNISK